MKNNKNKNDRTNNLHLFNKFFRFLFILFLNFNEDQSIHLYINIYLYQIFSHNFTNNNLKYKFK